MKQIACGFVVTVLASLRARLEAAVDLPNGFGGRHGVADRAVAGSNLRV